MTNISEQLIESSRLVTSDSHANLDEATKAAFNPSDYPKTLAEEYLDSLDSWHEYVPEPIAETERQRTLMAKLRQHPIVMNTVLVASGVLASFGAVSTGVYAADHLKSAEYERPDNATVLQKWTLKGHTDDDFVARAETLPPILKKPIKYDSKDSEAGNKLTKEIIEKNGTKFVGGYHSTRGLDFNFYTVQNDGKQPRQAEIHPETIEYLLDQIIDNVPNAPENQSKYDLMHNLENIQKGSEKRLLEVFISVGDGPECINEDGDQLIAFSGAFCLIGTTLTNSDRKGDYNSVAPIFLARVTKPTSLYSSDGNDVLEVPDDAFQTSIFAHEALHGTGVEPGVGSRADNEDVAGKDLGHTLIGWLVEGDEAVDSHGNSYDYEGAGPSPRLEVKISELIDRGELKPILTTS